MRIRLTKLSGKPNATLPIGYWEEGWVFEPKIGERVHIDPVDRTSQNERFDFFNTTKVEDIVGHVIITQNSSWEIKIL